MMGDWAFQYDTLNRLTLAAPADNAPSSYVSRLGCFAYDGFGNRTVNAYLSAADCSGATAATASYHLNSANKNEVGWVSQAAPIAYSAPSGFTYDAAGNVLADGQNQYAYDGEGRLCAVQNTLTKSYTGYLYNAAGTRTAAGTITSLSCNLATNGFAVSREYLLDLGGDQVTELSGTGAWKHSNVWAGAHLAATYDLKGLHFHLSDPLGTRRVQTNVLGQVENSFQSLPFGDGYVAVPTALATADDATENHFTGKERDAESGNDYFGARYYASAMGRFMSPDWAAKAEPVPYAKLDNPQTLNLYAYMRNNPLGGTDPDGHCDWCQKLYNAATGNGWKTDEQVAQKGVNNNVVLVQTSSIPGNKDTKEPDNESVRHVTYTPTKIENGVLKGPVSTDPSDPKVKVSLWESNNGGSYEQQGTTNGSGKDRILTGAGILSTPVDQHWSVNGDRVQVVVGKNPDGTVQTTWQLHVDRSGDVPQFTPVATPAPQ